MSLESTDGSARSSVRRALRDPIAIRALARPVRLRLRDLLDIGGPMTAAAAARELGISQGLASHHLRQLGKYGFVERAAARDDRERPWQITETSISWLGAEQGPAGAAAGELLEQVLADRAVQQLRQWQGRRADWSADWHDHSGLSQHLLYITAAEWAELGAAIEALVEPYARRRASPQTADEDGARTVDLTMIGVPLPQHSDGGPDR